MHTKMVSKVVVGCLLAVITLSMITSASSASAAAPQAQINRELFRKRSQLLLDNDQAMVTDDTTKKARLDRRKLEKRRVAPEDVAFLQELTNFSNDVVEASKTGQGLEGAAAKLKRYPKVQAYFAQATALQQDGQVLVLRKKSQPHPFKTFAIIGNPVTEAAGMADCGAFWNPKPYRSIAYKRQWSSNPTATLRSWGYHTTPGLAGGGWTRSQTWHPWNCGFNTFRDHAGVDGSYINEQNYAGWNPRGEPSPEVYASGPWPYSAWPSYVYWWHQIRNM